MAYTIQDLLMQAETFGVYDYLLPFILIFSVIFGILTATNILGGNKGVNLLVSFAIGLLALRFGYVQNFFGQVFPRLGVGLAAIVCLVILIGLFVPDLEKQYWGWGLAVIAFITWIIVVTGAFDQYAWYNPATWENYGGLIVAAVIVIGLIIAVASTTGSKGNTGVKAPTYNPWRPPQ